MNPHRRDEILSGLADAQAEWVTFAAGLPLDTFFAAPAGGWPPVTHLRHLTLTHRRVTQGLLVSRPALRALFGRPGTARPYPELVAAYRAALAAGGRAPARYVPAPDTTPSEAVRAGVMDAYARGAEALRAALDRWPDDRLDRSALPHDLLGRVSARELAFFTLYHDLHHLRGVQNALNPQALETP